MVNYEPERQQESSRNRNVWRWKRGDSLCGQNKGREELRSYLTRVSDLSSPGLLAVSTWFSFATSLPPLLRPLQPLSAGALPAQHPRQPLLPPSCSEKP